MKKIKLYSFDIFDTLFIRACGEPYRIFYITARKVLGDDADLSKVLEFLHIRKEGEYIATQKCKGEDVTLVDIYNECDFSDIAKMDNQKIMFKEIETERDNLIVVKNKQKLISKLRNQKDVYIAFVSDMYLPSSFLKDLLISNNLYEEGDLLLVSNEYGKKKSTGSLYQELLKQVRQRFRVIKWIHFGDNPQSDGIMSVKNGAKSHLVRYKSSYYQKWLRNKEIDPYNEPVATMSAMQKALLYHYGEQGFNKIIIDWILPLFLPFVFNILNDARKRNINHLFFFSRDGYTIYILCKEAMKCLQFTDIQIDYIHISRMIIYPSSLNSLTTNEIERYFNIEKRLMSVQSILEQFNLGKYLNLIRDIDEQKLTDKLLPPKEKRKLLEIIINNNAFRKAALKAIKRDRTLLLQYFEQEGVLKNINSNAFVDISGTRMSQYAINKILTEEGYGKLFGYYLCNIGDIPSIKETGNYYSMVSGVWGDQDLCTPLVEDVFSITDQGRTEEYVECNGKIKAIFSNVDNKNEKTKLMLHIQEILMKAVNLFVQDKLYLGLKEITNISIILGNEIDKRPHKTYLRFLRHFDIKDAKHSTSLLIASPKFRDFKSFLCNRCFATSSWKIGSVVSYLPLGSLIACLFSRRESIKRHLVCFKYHSCKLIKSWNII